MGRYDQFFLLGSSMANEHWHHHHHQTKLNEIESMNVMFHVLLYVCLWCLYLCIRFNDFFFTLYEKAWILQNKPVLMMIIIIVFLCICVCCLYSLIQFTYKASSASFSLSVFFLFVKNEQEIATINDIDDG